MQKGAFRFTFVCVVIAALLSIVGVYACNSGGSGSKGSTTASSEGATYGKVGILMADAPSDEFDHIYITITDVTLIPAGGGGSIEVFTSPEGYTLDLLTLRDENFLLTLNDQIPVGRYEKIRVGVSAIELVPKEDSSVCPVPELEIKLPSGKIDFIPDGGLDVIGGDTVYVRLDIDANKSINLHPTGDPCKYIFRPVVFIDIIKDKPVCFWRHSYRGTISELITHTTDEGATIVDGFLLSRDRTCLGTLEVDLAVDTVIFTGTGTFGAAAALAKGQEVLVRGIMDEEGALIAKVVIIGDAMILKGTVTGVVGPVEEGSTVQTFDLTLDDGQELIGDVSMPVIVYPQTLVRSGCDITTLDGVADGTPVIVTGKYDIATDTFKAVSIQVLPLPAT